MIENKKKILSLSEKLSWLRLIRSENVGPITFFKLLERFGTVSNALKALPDLARRGGKSGRIKIASKADAEQEMQSLQDLGIQLIAWGEADYPPLLARIEDPPPLITVLGHTHLLAKKAIAIVGARNASVNGIRFARKIAEDLGQAGVLVVSGMARGIDAGAHEGALASGTIGVLAGGVDVVYPKENEKLYQAIQEQGALVSEIAVGTKPQARHFPRRNRLISGISRGVVVVEAARRSGSLITANFALEQGREVFSVPGSPLDPRAGGTIDLIRQGATVTESAADIVNFLNGMLGASLEEPQGIDFKEENAPLPNEKELQNVRSRIEESLGPSPVSVDEIIRIGQFSPAVVAVVLLELELAGRLERHPGNQISLIRI